MNKNKSNEKAKNTRHSENALKIKGTFEDLLKVAVSENPKPKRKNKK